MGRGGLVRHALLWPRSMTPIFRGYIQGYWEIKRIQKPRIMKFTGAANI